MFSETHHKQTNLLGLSREQLVQFFNALGEPAFRAQQLMRWIYMRGKTDFSQMTDLKQTLRQQLTEVACIHAPEMIYHHKAQDGTCKWILKLDTNNSVETVFIPEGQRGTLCISSQVGCALDCQFCATGKQGFQRNLSAVELISQVWHSHRLLLQQAPELGTRPITNIVFMGMGEPLLNFEAVITAIKILRDDLGYGISRRRITVSTAGIVPAIKKLRQQADVCLAISLHAPSDALRDQLVPINRKYPLDVLLSACHEYLQGQRDLRRLTMEYVLLQGVNDSITDAKLLIRRLQDLPCKVNLIPFNPFAGTEFKRPTEAVIRRFQTYLQRAGLVTTVRKTRGDDIAAACGQLVGQVQDRTRRKHRQQVRQQGLLYIPTAKGF